MAPAQQRLDGDDAPGLQIALRLIMHGKLIGREALAQLALQQAGAPRDQVHLRRKETAAVAAVRLGAVHGQLGVLEQPVGVLTVRREHGDADARAGVHLLAPGIERLAEAVDHPARQRARIVGAAHAGLQDREFVAPEPRDRPGVVHAALQPRGHRAKQQIAAGQAERVVDSLEAIEIEQEHGGLRRGRAGRASGHAREDP